MVNDARAILDALAEVSLDDEQAQLVGLLALVAGQDVEPGATPGSWRIARNVAKDRVISTVDPETRHMHKSRSVYRDGYKAHIAVEPDTGIITGVDLTPANTGDGPTGIALLAGEEPGLEVLADSAYGSGQVRHDLDTADVRHVEIEDDQLERLQRELLDRLESARGLGERESRLRTQTRDHHFAHHFAVVDDEYVGHGDRT